MKISKDTELHSKLENTQYALPTCLLNFKMELDSTHIGGAHEDAHEVND